MFSIYFGSNYRLLLILPRFVFSLLFSIIIREKFSLGIRNRASGKYAEFYGKYNLTRLLIIKI